MRPSASSAVGLTLLAIVLAAAQTNRPVFNDFEVATIKPAGPDDLRAGRYIRMQGGHRVGVKSYTVNGLIAAAYDLNPCAISGDSGWSGSDLYDIVAKTPSDQRPTYDEQMVMLKKLLTDRFNLAIHREEREFSIYELTVAKGGPKTKTSTAPFLAGRYDFDLEWTPDNSQFGGQLPSGAPDSDKPGFSLLFRNNSVSE
jgi:hypothetical protein